MYNNNNALNEDQISAFLKDAVSRVESASESDVQLFNTIKKLYKQNVPFSRRKYVAALLVKMMAGHSRFGRDSQKSERGDRHSSDRFERRNDRSSRYDREAASERPAAARGERAERTERPARGERTPRVQIDPSVAATIFISIGRNRRVYPRDLVGLLVSVAGLERERIGDIRVLANYSFVQLFKDDCDKVISALNDYDYRGRKLSVSYSQKKEGDEEQRPVAAGTAASAETQAPLYAEEDKIPENVSNVSYGVSESSETSRISEAQSAFAAEQTHAFVETKVSSGDSSGNQAQYSKTTDDGQVTSHFGTGAAY